MPSEIIVQILSSELAQIVESVFATMMSLDATRSGASWFPSADHLTSAVHLAGDWNGAVLLECDRRQACRFAGRFLSMDPPETVDDVVRRRLGIEELHVAAPAVRAAVAASYWGAGACANRCACASTAS